ncbi:HK97-gp10 family putative phage morphogenesis protein [Mesorhizobium sp. CAU 1732]|uniref:HK97-gp10 family putative phage morphogenesis protein n=1 Tax=Mesorhizobium sp. CAU 1732 TaxID=3140358 RepID=UPI0032616A68
MKILNMERLKRKLARIPDAVKRRAQADLLLAGREINMLQRSLAPKDDGVLAGTIRTEALTDGTVGVEIKAGGAATTKAVRNSEKGNSPNYDYALAQEFGTKDMSPNPFFYPGYRARRKKALANVRRGWKRAMKDAASNG